MSKTAKIVATAGVCLAWFAVLAFGGIRTDWPWDALWTDPAAVRWSEVLKIVAVQALGGLAVMMIWFRKSPAS